MEIVKVKADSYSEDLDIMALCSYIIDPQKTGNGYYTFGRGLEPKSAYEEIFELQELRDKADRHRAYHMIVSFEDSLGFCGEDALEIAYRISDLFFPQYQVLCGVHPYQDHMHAHFAISTAPIQAANNRKLHIDFAVMSKLKKNIDDIIADYIKNN